jgi:C4-dicarboxylate transporter DctM subunit
MSVVGLIFMDVPLTLIPQVMFGSVDKFTLLPVPFFIFAGRGKELRSKSAAWRRSTGMLLRPRQQRKFTFIA